MNDAARAAAVCLHANDNVVVAVRNLTTGTVVPGLSVRPVESIATGHKMATAFIASGQPILKYGQVIGVATRDILPGAHVHVHNVIASEIRVAAQRVAPADIQEHARTFQGYRRADGRVGVRNYVCVLTSVNCSATVASGKRSKSEALGYGGAEFVPWLIGATM